LIVEVEVFDPADLPIGGIQIVADQVVYIALHKFFLIGLQSTIQPFRLAVVQRNRQFHFSGRAFPFSMIGFILSAVVADGKRKTPHTEKKKAL
jgi:hypothetical protein